MLLHSLKLIWNKRRANGLLFLEVVLAFLVLFGVLAFVLFNYDRWRAPLGFEHEDSLLVYVMWPEEADSTTIFEYQERLLTEVKAVDGVSETALIGFAAPFSGNTWRNITDDNGFEIDFKGFPSDEHTERTARLKVTEGRWYREEDKLWKYPPVVINRAFQEKYFPEVPTLVDSVIFTDGQTRIVGVVEDFKYNSNFAEREPIVFFPQKDEEIAEDPRFAFSTVWVRTDPGKKILVQEDIHKAAVAVTKDPNVTIRDVAKVRDRANRPTLVPIVALSVIAGFLLINAALGLFGVLFTQINRRRAEIGLRKAMGATPREVIVQFVLEVLLVTGSALLLGLFFAVQVPLLDLTSIPDKFMFYGMVGAVIIITLIVALCAIIPSWQASRLQPAKVLHEE